MDDVDAIAFESEEELLAFLDAAVEEGFDAFDDDDYEYYEDDDGTWVAPLPYEGEDLEDLMSMFDDEDEGDDQTEANADPRPITKAMLALVQKASPLVSKFRVKSNEGGTVEVECDVKAESPAEAKKAVLKAFVGSSVNTNFTASDVDVWDAYPKKSGGFKASVTLKNSRMVL